MSVQETGFGERLALAVQSKRSAVCVGLDPRWQSLPEQLRADVAADDLIRAAQVTANYCRSVIDAVAASAAVVKPQAAFFEQLGPHGMFALHDVILHAQQAGLLVILDGKRGDIGTTATGYAEAYLGRESPWHCDALTVNPFLGDDTLVPFIDTARKRGAGIFVLVKTSNPGSGFLQDVSTGEGTISQRLADVVQSSAAKDSGAAGYGSIGAVVGATYPQQLAEFRQAMPNAWILIPGYGAQGGTAADVALGFDRQGLGAIVNSSRGIIFAYERAEYQHLPWQEAIARAASDMAQELQP